MHFWSFGCVRLAVSVAALGMVSSVFAAPLSIGHRGNSLVAPENTLASFRAALGKADLVELDGQLTADGQLIVMHDSTVDRTTDGTGAISSLTLAKLKTFDAGSWFAASFAGERIPTLAEAVTNILPQATPLIERKGGSAAQYVAELQRLGVATNVVVQAFDWAFLSAVHALDPSIRLAALGSGALTGTQLASITNTGARTVAWEKGGITAAEVALVHDAGLKLFVWTVDGPEIDTYASLGVDGIISNDPARVASLQQTNLANAPYLGDHLVAYWAMDDGLTNIQSTALTDSAGTNALTFVRTDRTSHWLSGGSAMFGGAVEVDGTTSYVIVPHTPGLDINTNEITISTWLKLTTLPSKMSTTYGALLDSTNDCYVLYLDRSNKELRFKVTDAKGHAARPGISETFLRTNEWIHVVATYTGQAGPLSGQAVIYLNGQARDVHTGNDNTSPIGLVANVKTGQYAGIGREGYAGSSYFVGSMDDLAIWNRALTSAEVARLHQRGASGTSLAGILAEPTSALQFISVQPVASSGALEIRIHAAGTWQALRLHRATAPNGPYSLVPGAAPVALDNGDFRFEYPRTGATTEYFRIEGSTAAAGK